MSPKSDSQWDMSDYATCEGCGALWVPKSVPPSLAKPVYGFSLCLWCQSRQRRALIFPLYFVRELIKRPCEKGIMGPADQCRCTSCAARHIWFLYRKQLIK